MIEMGVMPSAWREESRENREYLLAVRRLMRQAESVEVHEARESAGRSPMAPPARGGGGAE